MLGRRPSRSISDIRLEVEKLRRTDLLSHDANEIRYQNILRLTKGEEAGACAQGLVCRRDDDCERYQGGK